MNHPLGLITVLAGIVVGAHVILIDARSGLPIGRFDWLVHPDGHAGAWDAESRLPLGLDGSEETLLSLLQPNSPTDELPRVSEGGTLTSWLNDRPFTLDAAVLIEAAISLSHASVRFPLHLEAPHTFGSLLAVLIAIKNSQAILVKT